MDRNNGRKLNTEICVKSRDSWGRRAEFLLSCISLAVGLGNIWRFPWLAQKNGGGAFLIPYFIMLIIEGIPLFYLELCIGQRMQLGPIPLWEKLSPFSRGVGFSMCLTAFVVACFYNVVISWCLYYLFKSFFSPLPWSNCPTVETVGKLKNITITTEDPSCAKIGPSLYYYYYQALEIGKDIDDTSGMNWQLTVSLLVAWIIVFLCMMKGIKTSGKVVYFTAVAPYLVLTVFLVQGFMMEGYEDGLKHFFLPEWSRLKDPMVWLEAAAQIFFSLGVGYGGLIAYASYNPPHQSPLRDTLIITLVNCGTSLFAGTVIFAVLGSRAHALEKKCIASRYTTVAAINTTAYRLTKENLNQTTLSTNQLRALWEVVTKTGNGSAVPWTECDKKKFLSEGTGGTGLAFVAFTDAINQLPAPSFFSVIFFLMLVTLGLGSMFGSLEGLTTSLRDMKVFRKAKKELVAVSVALPGFALGLVFTQYSGEYMIQLLNSYSADLPPLIIALFELVAVSYFYGINRFASDLSDMTGKSLCFVWKIMWSFISPLVVVIILGAFVVLNIKKTPVYEVWDRQKVESVKTAYPNWALTIGIGITVICIIPIFLGALMGLFAKMRGRHVKPARCELERRQPPFAKDNIDVTHL